MKLVPEQVANVSGQLREEFLRIWDWWLAELGASLQAMLSLFGGLESSKELLITIEGGQPRRVDRKDQAAGIEHEGELASGLKSTVVLQLPADDVYYTSLNLPVNFKGNLHNTVSLLLHRHSPLPVADTQFCICGREATERGEIVRVGIARLSVIDTYLEQLQTNYPGLSISRVQAGAGCLFPEFSRKIRFSPKSMLWAATVVGVSLLIVVGCYHYVIQSLTQQIDAVSLELAERNGASSQLSLRRESIVALHDSSKRLKYGGLLREMNTGLAHSHYLVRLNTVGSGIELQLVSTAPENLTSELAEYGALGSLVIEGETKFGEAVRVSVLADMTTGVK